MLIHLVAVGSHLRPPAICAGVWWALQGAPGAEAAARGSHGGAREGEEGSQLGGRVSYEG